MPIFLLFLLLFSATAFAEQSIYKYQDADGNWHFSDKQPAKPVKKITVDKIRDPHVRNVKLNYIDKSNALIKVKGFDIEIINDYYAPVEIELSTAYQENVDIKPNLPATFIIPARSKKIIATITQRYSYYNYAFKPKTKIVMGNPNIPSKNYAYSLPFAQGEAYFISQAFKGEFSHTHPQSLYAVDFPMPEGSWICAAREGLVVEVAEDYLLGGLDSRYLSEANFVRILHDDGTMAVYAHLKPGSVLYRAGASIKKGACFGRSGNTGYSSGPHLHFVIQQNTGLKLESIPFVFQGEDGQTFLPTKGQLVKH